MSILLGALVSAVQFELPGPISDTIAMLAERCGADNGRIARIILWTTVAAFFTFPLTVAGIR